MTRKKRNAKKATAPTFVVTLEMVELMQQALTLFEEPLQRADHHDPKIAFAEVTFRRVRTKLTAIEQSKEAVRLTTFDRNERIILTQAVRLYAVHLSTVLAGRDWTKELGYCRQLVAHFSQGTGLLH
jgi:hypothetical protein